MSGKVSASVKSRRAQVQLGRTRLSLPTTWELVSTSLSPAPPLLCLKGEKRLALLNLEIAAKSDIEKATQAITSLLLHNLAFFGFVQSLILRGQYGVQEILATRSGTIQSGSSFSTASPAQDTRRLTASRPNDAAVYLCNEKGFPLQRISPGIHAPGFDFSAYLRSPYITQLNDQGILGLGELDPKLTELVERAKDSTRR